MKYPALAKGALVAMTAFITVMTSNTLAVAGPDRPAPDLGAGSARTLLGHVSSTAGRSSTARLAGSDDGIVAVTLSASSLRLADRGCGRAGYTMSMTATGPTPVGSWSASATITGPAGDEVGYGVLYNDSPTDYMYLCATDDRPGTYGVTVSWIAYDEASQQLDQGTDTATFTFSVAPAPPKVGQRLKMHKHHWGRHGWRVTGTLTRGGHRRAHVRVYVDAIIKGYGYDLFSARTNKRGIVTFRFRPKKGAARFKLALYVREDATSKAAWSRTFRLRHR
jgi:hypothetical protein